MATFEVIVLGVQGINNKVFGPGAKVTEAHFPEGNALKLEKEGKLKRISSKKEEAEAAKAEKEAPKGAEKAGKKVEKEAPKGAETKTDNA
jgi:hypothetical protein